APLVAPKRRSYSSGAVDSAHVSCPAQPPAPSSQLPMNPFSRADYLLAAHNARQLPPDAGAEVAFAGRSNAGKSSALNALCGRNALARVSKTPGRTQQLVYFALPPFEGRH